MGEERKKIRKKVGTLDLTYVTLADLFLAVEVAIAQYGGDAIVDEYQESYDQNTYSGGIFQAVDETDEEWKFRLAREARYAAEREESELKEFKRLLAKFHLK